MAKIPLLIFFDLLDPKKLLCFEILEEIGLFLQDDAEDLGDELEAINNFLLEED